MIRRIDLFLGKRVFVPVVIWICQRAGVSQWRFANYARMAAYWLLIWVVRESAWGWTLVVGALAVGETMIAALWPDYERETNGAWWRVLVVAIMVFDAIAAAFGWLAFWLIILAAEYALTIKTIPPRETKEPKRQAIEVRA